MSDPILLCSKCGDSQTRFSSSAVENLKAYSADNVDRALVAALAAEADSELQGYDAQIKRVEEMLKNLREEKEKVSQHRDRCRYLISTVRRVPPETWLEILGLLCREEPYSTRWKNPAVIIAGVCKQWRRFCLSSPAFWTTFVVDLRHGHVTSREFIQMHRRRSSPLNLSIHFNFPDSEDQCRRCHDWTLWDEEEPHLQPRPCSTNVLQYLMEFSDRFADFRFTGTVSFSVWMQALVEDQQEQSPGFPSLETLNVGSEEPRHSRDGEEFDLGVFSGAVNLRHLTLWSYSGEFCPASWTQLTTVDLNYVEISVVHDLLSQCPNLRDADISVIGEWSLDNDELTPFDSNSLLSLKIDFSDPELVNPLFTPMTLPSLQSLEIGTRVEVDDLLGLCERSSFPLRHLLFRGKEKDDFNIWRNVFLAIPTLSSFIFFDTPVPQDFFHQLTFSADNDHPVLPQLTKFELSCEKDTLVSIITMVESRFLLSPVLAHNARPTAALVKVKEDIDWVADELLFDPTIMARVNRLCDLGMDLRVDKPWICLIDFANMAT
ncbi:hypothetical protein C8J56DRAFT_1172664 [Mycena floridula]|nr:hypothetical protein C8J56DRAFT_1172664 [Mycena floridula]